MKSLFTYDFTTNTIFATKTTLKKASIPNSPEYKALMKLVKQNPACTVAEKKPKESSTVKKTYKGLNAAFIKKYLSIQENADELTRQYDKALELGQFQQARKWFFDTFKNFDMDAAKKEMEQAVLTVIRTPAAKSENRIFNMPAAVNQ